jgi:hypothetical protein
MAGLSATERPRSDRTRLMSLLTLKRKTWQRHPYLRGILVAFLFISSAAALGHWYLWATGQDPLRTPILWTVVSVVAFATVPRKRVLIFGVLGLYTVYGLKAVFLNREPRAWYLVGAAAVLLAILVLTTPRD